MKETPAPPRPLPATTPLPAIAMTEEWSVEDSLELYGLPAWGNGYFSGNKAGEVTVRLQNNVDFAEVSLPQIIRGLVKKNKDFHLPALFRFPDLLYARIKELNETFREEMRNQEIGRAHV